MGCRGRPRTARRRAGRRGAVGAGGAGARPSRAVHGPAGVRRVGRRHTRRPVHCRPAPGHLRGARGELRQCTAAPASSRTPTSGCTPASGRRTPRSASCTSASLSSGQDECAADFSSTVASVDADYLGPVPRPIWPPRSTKDRGRSTSTVTCRGGDDSLWMGLAIMAADSRAPTPVLLERAEAVFDLAVADWDRADGGVYWEESGAGGQERAVVSNAPAVLLGVELYGRTGQARYLRWSERDMAWLQQHLADPTDGLYDDHVDGAGNHQTMDRTSVHVHPGRRGGRHGRRCRRWTRRGTRCGRSGGPGRPSRDYDVLRGPATPTGTPGSTSSGPRTCSAGPRSYRQPAFTARAERSVRSAAAAEPAPPGDLLDTSSEATLAELVRLPPARATPTSGTPRR